MGYGYKIPANQLRKWKNLWVLREYGLYLVCVRRESTVASYAPPYTDTHVPCPHCVQLLGYLLSLLSLFFFFFFFSFLSPHVHQSPCAAHIVLTHIRPHSHRDPETPGIDSPCFPSAHTCFCGQASVTQTHENSDLQTYISIYIHT